MTGNVYVFTTPINEYLTMMGMNATQTPDATKRQAGFSNNGLATISRADEDTLVIQKNYSMPSIYVWCPN